ncbi:MAG TPA: SapC family protein [Burkholderiales bacterium]
MPRLSPPFGYDEIVPLEKSHRVLMPAGNTPSFCRTINALAVSVGEFAAAARDYPVVFATVDAGASFAPVIVLGFEPNVNLFVDPSGEWDRQAYLPAYVRRFPFCLSTQRAVCVVKSYLDPGGVPLFDAQGAPTPRWQAAEQLLAGFEADLERTAQMCAALARLELLEPFSVQMKDAPQIQVSGMARVAEAKLGALSAARLKALVDKGFLGLVYAHLYSLENFSRLAARWTRAQAAGRS